MQQIGQLHKLGLSPECGEHEVKFRCDKFGLSISNLKNDFRDYKDGGNERLLVTCPKGQKSENN